MEEEPTRCVILDVDGEPFRDGLFKRTPEASRPHVGKEGLAEFVTDGVRITLDGGAILWGYECWWEPIPQAERRRRP